MISGSAHNSGYAVRAEYRPLPNCPALRFGQLRIAAEHYIKSRAEAAKSCGGLKP